MALNEGICVFMADLQPICAEYVLETFLERTEEITVLKFFLQYMFFPKIGSKRDSLQTKEIVYLRLTYVIPVQFFGSKQDCREP
jgi:hypothetical protein